MMRLKGDFNSVVFLTNTNDSTIIIRKTLDKFPIRDSLKNI